MASPSSLSEPDDRHQIYSRKQKSLGVLCANFISLYGRDDVDSISLDDAAKKLGVERRRIYDIVNVMESVGALSRSSKNRYAWVGFAGIPMALEDIKKDRLQGIACSPRKEKFMRVSDHEEEEIPLEENESTREDTISNTLPRNGSDQRREKSLGQLTRNFVKLFLTYDVDTVSLDEAARLLLGDCHDVTQMKTKVRRLYDIANVLASMNLIEKVQHSRTKKPAFKWLGCQGKQISTAKPCNKRAFGIEMTNMEQKRSKLKSNIGGKTKKVVTKLDSLKECNLTARKQLQVSKNFVFGPFQPTVSTREEGTEAERGAGKFQGSMASSPNHLQYHNQALSDLFVHYVEAWESWVDDFIGLKHPYKLIIDHVS